MTPLQQLIEKYEPEFCTSSSFRPTQSVMRRLAVTALVQEAHALGVAEGREMESKKCQKALITFYEKEQG